ncbi:hypothetical protein [Brevundimonas sp.]|uniref:hypothetical protein n=1 Tax=Brevundimonas sp. TaxID=1871086 RepID=UPI002D56F9E7|nr:hypothetical protein [Brevundimonas sp.]HYD29199.1 hypothetical protein [Brevundimonas sp.]
MTALTKDTPRDYETGERNALPIAANTTLYEGAAVGDNGAGYARPLAAGDKFRGFAVVGEDNAAGSAGDARVLVREAGKVQLAIAGLAITDVGKPVYASDDATFTLTQGTNSHIGRVHRFVSSGVGIVAFDCRRAGLGALAELTDNSGGVADGTIAVVGATNGGDVSAAINGNFADLAAKVNALVRMIG